MHKQYKTQSFWTSSIYRCGCLWKKWKTMENENLVNLQGHEIPQLHNFASERQSSKSDFFYHISESTEKGISLKTSLSETSLKWRTYLLEFCLIWVLVIILVCVFISWSYLHFQLVMQDEYSTIKGEIFTFTSRTNYSEYNAFTVLPSNCFIQFLQDHSSSMDFVQKGWLKNEYEDF